MFQFAFYLALKEKGKNIKLDATLYSYTKMHNGYELDRCFSQNEPLIKSDKIHLFILRILLKLRPKILVLCDNLYYDEKVLSTKSLILSGYWQSEKYFKSIECLVREKFVFRNIDNKTKALASEISSLNSVSLHIRRGDYLGHSLYSGVCTEEYYRNSVECLKLQIDSKQDLKFFVFSDEKDFATQFVNKLNVPAAIIERNTGIDSYKDMYLMSHCKHNIIANSSFSWWGAWLNKNPDKIIIAPKKWFGSSSDDKYKDILPENWIKI